MLVLLLISLHTPPAMAAYKWYLINLALTCYAMDLFTGLFFIPINILPIYGGCTLGLLKPLNSSATYIGWGVLNMLLGVTGAATVYAMLYRTMSVYNKEYLLKRKPIVLVMVVVELTYAWPAVITADLVHPGDEESVKFIKEWLIPTGMITVSYITFAVVASMQLSSSGTVCFITFLVSTFHTTVNGVIMIATIRPYKDALVKYVRIVVRKRQVAALSSPVINRDKPSNSISKLIVAAANPPIQPS
ncbi:serpentine type 7TM GPCR chemoreceptor srh domain-containing protein [Ditylenchus destructor]|nr:serpentine type 7TM GPCR chemoreceptor srh domain-containing protein [Ditylenchus destructor]